MAPDKQVFRKLSPDQSILALNYAIESNYEDNTLWNFYAYYCKYGAAELKRNFFAVIVHGSPDQVCGGNAQNLFRIVNHQYQQFGYNRAVLMASCYSGVKIAPELSKIMKVPVLAGTSTVTFNDNDDWQVTREKGDGSSKYKLTWVMFHKGKKKIISTTVLQPDAAIKGLQDWKWPVRLGVNNRPG
jgi:hypothetical protein